MDSVSVLSASNIRVLGVDELVPSPLNPRRHSEWQYEEAELWPLADSLQAQRQWDLITVRRSAENPAWFEIINGERRWRAACLAGLPTLEARVVELDDAAALAMMMQTGGGALTVPLSPMAEAHGLEEQVRILAKSQKDVAVALGMAPVELSRKLSWLDLPKGAQVALDRGELKPALANIIASVPGDKAREEFARAVMHPEHSEGPLTVRAAVALRDEEYAQTLRGAPFKLDDAGLVPEAGACSGCPFMAGNNPEVYGELPREKRATCMMPECFAKKCAAVRAVVVAEYAARGVVALEAAENEAAFPRGGDGLDFRAKLVEYHKPVPPELLKAEVVAEGAVVRWEDISTGAAASVVVRLAFDQQGKAVEVVRVAEAICAVDANEHAIFNEATRLQYGLEKQQVARVPKAMKVARAEAEMPSEGESKGESAELEESGGSDEFDESDGSLVVTPGDTLMASLGCTRAEIMEALRELVADACAYREVEEMPQMAAILDYIEVHGLPAKEGAE